VTGLDRHLARAETLAATLSGASQERAQAVLEALALLKVYCTDLTTARAVAIAMAVADELSECYRRPSDAEIAASAHSIGVRATARLTGVSKSTVSRIARAVPNGTEEKAESSESGVPADLAVPNGTATPLPLPKPARMVDAFMERGSGGGAGLLIHRGAPADLATNTGGDQAMLGNGSKGPALISPQAAIAVLFERLERLEKLPANAEEAAKQQAERLQIRRRLSQERFSLIDALAREGVALAARAEKARHTLDYASGPAARAAADEALRAVLHEQQSNSCAQEHRPAALAKELRRTADPRLRAWQVEVELEIEVCACYEAPFVPYTQQEREHIKRKAETARAPEGDRDVPGYSPGVIVLYPRLSGAPDLTIYNGIALRKAALTALKLKLRDEWPLEPLTADELTSRYERERASIPRIPDGASQVAGVPLPEAYTVDLSNILTKYLDPLIISDTPREAPREILPDGTVYVNGVPQ
jgi:hypothetical protein